MLSEGWEGKRCELVKRQNVRVSEVGWEGKRRDGWEGRSDLIRRRKDKVLRVADGREKTHWKTNLSPLSFLFHNIPFLTPRTLSLSLLTIYLYSRTIYTASPSFESDSDLA